METASLLRGSYRAGQVAAEQAYMFSEQDGYLLRIDNINASGEDLINILINVAWELRFHIVAIMKTMIFAAILFVIKFR